jgi:hypothetical protein
METTFTSDIVAMTAFTGSYPGKVILKCVCCGHVSSDRNEVDYFNVHIGGKGEVRRPECVNQPACWERMGW